jgi:hypothetical protein
MQTLWIATRKGLFAARRVNGRWTLDTTPAFLGEPVTMVLDDARDNTLYAALNLGHFGVKLHRSGDNGATWQECAAPSYAFAAPPDATAPAAPAAGSSASASSSASSASAATGDAAADADTGATSASVSAAAPADAAAKLPSLFMIWSLEAGGANEPGVVWAGTIPGALFRSADRGDSWTPVRALWDRPERQRWFGGGYDHPGIHSILVDPRDAARVTVGVSCGGAWHTDDGGDTWSVRAKGMTAAYMPPEQRDDPNVQDPHRIVSCPASPDFLWTQHHNGVFASDDGGREWREVTAARPSGFGFAVAVHPRDPKTAWFVPAVKDERRVPVDGKLVVSRTRDGGQSFDVLDRGLPAPSYDLVYRHGLDVDRTGTTLAVGSTTGGVWMSEDGGDSWQMLSAHLPPVYAVRFGRE